MSNSVTAPTAFSLESIHTENGLYSLNDLHCASGGEDKHSPRKWTRLQQTKDLIAEIEKVQKWSILKKQGLGTFVCKELVCAYAAWISPAFHLQVIRTFLASVIPQPSINAEQQQQIRELIARVSNETSKGFGELYARFHNRFKIPRYQELPADRFGDAIEYLSAKLPKQQMFYGLTDGRYLLHIENGQSLIKDVSDYSLIKPEHVWAFRRNLKLLAEQSSLFMGEAGEELIAQELEVIV